MEESVAGLAHQAKVYAGVLFQTQSQMNSLLQVLLNRFNGHLCIPRTSQFHPPVQEQFGGNKAAKNKSHVPPLPWGDRLKYPRSEA